MEAMKISEKEEIVNRMLYIASRYGLEYEVKAAYEVLIKYDNNPSIEDVRKCASAALYEWDL